MHRVVVELGCSPGSLAARFTAVLVPTRGAAESLRQTLERQLLSGETSAVILPDIVTRGEFYARLHVSMRSTPAMLSQFEREVLFRRAARVASEQGREAPFRLRAGLIAEILRFYDELRRSNRGVADFDRLMTSSLEPSAGVDRGAERMLRQTRFLAAAFSEFERLVAASGRIDEHGFRERLLSHRGATPYRHIVVAMTDQSADQHGLWTADYDLLARMPGVERIDIIATEIELAAGFHQRLHDLLPGIEEEHRPYVRAQPTLMVPDSKHSEAPLYWFVARDREEELADVARMVKAASPPDRVAVIFQRPLPYIYLARQVFADAQLIFQALDALPLAAEPFAAAVDLMFTFAITEGTRASLIDLMASPQWQFGPAECPIGLDAVAVADGLLRELKYLGGWDRLEAVAAEASASSKSGSQGWRWRRAEPVLQAASAAGKALRAALAEPTASGQVQRLVSFMKAHERLPQPADPWYERHLRARSAIVSALQSLADAHARHDDSPLAVAELAGTVRRWVEGQTFAPRTGSAGVALLDASAAVYADVDEVRLAGLVDSDWPNRPRRSIFYPAALLSQLGWPKDSDRLAAARARFHDLLLLARSRVSVSSFTLEDDAIVAPSAFLEDLHSCGLPVGRVPVSQPPRVFLHEALCEEPTLPSAIVGQASEWLALRMSRSPSESAMFRGDIGPRGEGVYGVSHLERYLECPFKYFAAYVLRLEEEREEESGLTAQERGRLLHAVFERFFARWQASGGCGITVHNVDRALKLFQEVAEEELCRLPEADRALERTHLLGSAAAAGLAERAFALEIEQGVDVIERLLEHPLEGRFDFRFDDVAKAVDIRAKADRIDLMTNGTLRVIDYKLGKAPKPARALQLPVYGVCAEQRLAGRHGRSWKLASAGYIAFREKRPFVLLGASSSLQEAVADGQRRLLSAVSGIERGTFVVDPDEPFLCSRCGYAPVCRKDYVGDE